MSVTADGVIDRIYEAALVPELWRLVIDDLCAASGSASGALIFAHPEFGQRGVASEHVDEVFQRHIALPDWADNPRAAYVMKAMPRDFVCLNEVLSTQTLRNDPFERGHNLRGAGFQCCATVPLPTGDIGIFTFERALDRGAPSPADLATLDRFRTHLARAAVLATRVERDRLQASIDTVQAIGIPAAALTADGRVLAANPSFERLPLVRSGAFGQLHLVSEAADALLQHSLRQASAGDASAVLSIPVPAQEDRPAQVLHLVPIRGAAHDVFARAAFLLAVSTFGEAAATPSLSVLSGLFDLTPKEAQLAAALATGKSLQEAAALNGIQYSTARTHLEHIFQKTGVRQQTQLVLLLQGARGIGAPA